MLQSPRHDNERNNKRNGTRDETSGVHIFLSLPLWTGPLYAASRHSPPHEHPLVNRYRRNPSSMPPSAGPCPPPSPPPSYPRRLLKLQ